MLRRTKTTSQPTPAPETLAVADARQGNVADHPDQASRITEQINPTFIASSPTQEDWYWGRLATGGEEDYFWRRLK